MNFSAGARLAMTGTDVDFTGSIPGLYDRYLGPLLFEPYAKEIARRVQALRPLDILETAAGTGIVTAAVHQAVPDASITATDLNGTMLEVAAGRMHSPNVRFDIVDAQDLPFKDESFDLVLCQFGAMFYTDRIKANSEAYRVLRKGGRYISLIWDDIERNPASKLAMDTVARLYPEDPPSFFYRMPHGYSDPDSIRGDLVGGGFETIELETVSAMSGPISAKEAAVGICQGTPLRNELETREHPDLEAVTSAVASALGSIELEGRLQSFLSAHVLTATK